MKDSKLVDGMIIGAIVCTVGGVLAHSIPEYFNKNQNKTCSLITINNGEVHVFDSVKKDNFSFKKYSYQKLSDTACYIYVYGEDAPNYADFILSNIYIGENNKIIFDENNVTGDNYEYYCVKENESTEGIQRSRKE